MAKKRMMSTQIIDSDDFLDMPLSTQALYFHLLARADDEGFTNGVKKVIRTIGARDDDLKLLIGKRFVLMFDSGVVVIKHWLIHNTIRPDRIIPTVHIKEKGQLRLNNVKGYTEAFEQPTDICQHSIGLGLDLDIGLDIVKDIVEQSPTVPYQSIISYLNQNADTHFKATSQVTQKHIKARFNEKYTLEDFYKVIDTKCNEWLKTDMAKFLRPETLFGSKFESYLNQPKQYKQSNKIEPSQATKERYGEA